MDKHDRPYRCDQPECSKLQGFTYSGGLLRHQREVHKMHGGTGKQLFCPEKTCKRHTGSGFTRKENLQEHLRRVHRRTSTGLSDMDSNAAAHAQRVAEEVERMPSAEREIHEQEPAFRHLIEATNSLQASAGAPVATMIGSDRIDAVAANAYAAANGHTALDPAIDETSRLQKEIESRDAKIEALERQNQQQGERLFKLEQQMLQMTAQQGNAV